MITVTYKHPSTIVVDQYENLRLIVVAFGNYAWIPIVVFGIPGNVIAFCVALRRHNRHLSPCVYIAGIAVADLSILITNSVFYIFWEETTGILTSREMFLK